MEHLLRATALAEQRHFWFRGLRAFVTPLLERAAGGRTDLQILDCGCGTGANLELLSTFGRAYGFDLSDTGIRLGRAVGRRRLARANVAAVPFPAASFDLVTSFDVLYSLPSKDEAAAVSEMFRITKPGGCAVINVAAMNVLRGDHSVLSRELRRYRKSDLSALLTRAGFRIERITYTNATLFLPMALARAIQRWRGLSSEAEAQTEIRVPRAPVNAVLTAMLLAESAWLRRFGAPFGSSLLCLARKPS